MESTAPCDERKQMGIHVRAVNILILNHWNTDSSEECEAEGEKEMECPNCKAKIDKAKQGKARGNFYYCKNCGTVISR
ncbi:MAG: hypothetical protein ACE5IF_00605 [Candidatus Bathyarchaeia archaeon]